MLLQPNKALLDPTGHYRLMFEDWITKCPEWQIDDVLRFIETPLGGYRPLPAARKFHYSKSRYRFAIGGNRSSKSQSLAYDSCLQLLDLHPTIRRPNHVIGWYASKTYEMIGQFVYPKLEHYLKGWPCTWGWIDKQKKIPSVLNLHNGKRTATLFFKAYDQGRETFQGAGPDFISLDEQFGQDIYDECITRISAERDLRVGVALTPIESQPWLERMLNEELKPGVEVFNFPLDDNRISMGGFLPDELIDSMIAQWPDEVVETRRHGRFGGYIGSIYQSFSREIHVVDEEREQRDFFKGDRPPVDWAIIGGIDWGGANPFAFVWVCRIPHMDNAYYVFDEYYWDSRKRGQRRLADHANHILQTTGKWGTTLWRTWADHDPTDAYEFEGYGVQSSPADKAEMRPGIEYIQTLMKVRHDTGRPRIFYAKRCQNLIAETLTYKWAESTDKKNAREEPVDKDNHALSAMRYAIYSDRGHDPSIVADFSLLESAPQYQF